MNESHLLICIFCSIGMYIAREVSFDLWIRYIGCVFLIIGIISSAFFDNKRCEEAGK